MQSLQSLRFTFQNLRMPTPGPVDITDKSQDVHVGEQITLYGAPRGGFNRLIPKKTLWTIEGQPIAGFEVSDKWPWPQLGKNWSIIVDSLSGKPDLFPGLHRHHIVVR